MTALAHVGGPLGCLGLAVLLVAHGRLARLTGLAAWALGTLLLALYVAPHGHRALLAGAAVAGVALAAGGGAILVRRPWLLAFAALLLVPARIPVSVGETDAQLLVPLYLVIGAAAAALAWELLRGEVGGGELGPVALPLAAFVAFTGLSLSWTVDLKKGAVELLFFHLPFGLLALCVARLPWDRAKIRLLLLELVGMALVLAVIGIGQEAARHVFWNPKVIVGNAYQPFFRVNSLFWDPSIYGRFLVVAILCALVVCLRRWSWLVAGVVALTWVGLLFAYSQSSFVALAAGVVAAAALLLRRRATMVAAVALLVVVALVAARPAAAPASPVVADSTSGRGKLVEEGIRIAIQHPVWGVGIGGFKRAYADRVGLRGEDPKRAASHTTPVTVVAETGVVGLALLVWLTVAVGLLVFRRPSWTVEGTALLAAGVTLLAIAVHSLGYNALFEDPTTWGALGIAALAAAARRRFET